MSNCGDIENQSFVLRASIDEAGYEEGKQAIKDIKIEVKSGELVGLIGPNGAGKSTTIKSILGLMTHMKGEIVLNGRNKRYAYVPEQPIYYEYFTLWEHLQLAASAFDIGQSDFEQRAKTLLERFRLTKERDHYPTSFSKGMQQKLMLIIAFLLEPDIYIVDEPFVGLDPRATGDFLSLLEDARKSGAGVLMSTHVLDTAERLCSSFVLVNSGTVVAKGSLADIRSQAACPDGATLFECFHALT